MKLERIKLPLSRKGQLDSIFYVATEESEKSMKRAKCGYCGRESLSVSSLPFFKEQKEKEFDEFYCGCFGFD